MGLVQHEGGPCGVLAAIQVMATFFNISYELEACCPFSKITEKVPISNNAKWHLFA